MLKVVSSKLVFGQSYLDEIGDVDWFGDEPDFNLGTPKDDEEEGVVNENNYEDYLADDLDQQEEPKEPVPGTSGDFLDEIPLGNEDLLDNPEANEVQYQNALDLVSDAINNQEVVSFEYVNRHGAYAGRRTVEPHYIFPAYTTGNTVLVAWDRGVNDIRAFIVGIGAGHFVSKKTDPSAGIQPGGVRYENEKFEFRPEILVT